MSVRFINERVVRAPNECTPQNSQTKKVTSNVQIKNHPEDSVLPGGADWLQFNFICGDWTKKLAWHEPERGRENRIFRLVSTSRDRPANRSSRTNGLEGATRWPRPSKSVWFAPKNLLGTPLRFLRGKRAWPSSNRADLGILH